MTKREYYEIREQLSFERPLWVTLAVVMVDLGLFGAALAGLGGWGGPPGYWAAQLLLALFYFHDFALLHECGHGNVHAKEPVNALFGHYFSLFCFLPYYPWKYIHHEHHTWTGSLDRDPTLKRVREMREANRVPGVVQFAWQSWVPLAGLLQHFVLWGYPLDAWQSGRLRGKKLVLSFASVAWIGAGYLLYWYYAPQAYALGAVWPSFLLYFLGVEMVNLPHHVGMPTYRDVGSRGKLPLWQQHRSTRSCWYPGRLSEALVLNFNLHTEHHFFPTLPWFKVKEARDLLLPRLNREYHREVGIGWNVENRSRKAEQLILKAPELEFSEDRCTTAHKR